MSDIQPTDEMTSALHYLMHQALQAVRMVSQFTNGDVMSAAMHIMVDAGMFQVEKGNCTRDQLIGDIAAAAKIVVTEWSADGDKGAITPSPGTNTASPPPSSV